MPHEVLARRLRVVAVARNLPCRKRARRVVAVAVAPRASDERLLGLAFQDERVLVTEDKDFGELVFVRRLPHGPIVRLVELTVDQQVGGMTELLDRFAAELTGPVMITITRGRVRIRR